jgi:hypothetical protein
MPKQVPSYVAAVAAGLCTAIAFSTNWALAGGDCVVHPNRQSTQDGHWYYRVDRVSYRKCWYLVEPRTSRPEAEVTAPRRSPDSALQLTFSSFFSLLSADFTGAKPAGAQQDSTNSDARAVKTRSDDLKNGDGTRVKRARIARFMDSNTGATPKLNRQSPTRPQVGRTDQPPLDQMDRNALFEEFLRWKAQAP